MSSYATAYLNDGRPLCSFRNGVDELFLMLFTEEDWIDLEGEEAQAFVPELPEDDQRLVGFRVSARVLRDRLDVMGVPLSVVVAEFDKLVQEKIRLIQTYRIPDGALAARQDAELAYFEALSWHQWIEQLHQAIGRGEPVHGSSGMEPLCSASWLMSLWDYCEERYPLRAIVEVLPDDAQITLDLTEVLEGDWLEPPIDPQSIGRQQVVDTSSSLLPVVVLVEGRFDAEVLSEAFRVRRPHLARYVRLPDFSHRNEGGAAALRQTVRAFASAGIPNRVVALFDNDAAARDVLRSIDTESLPSNIHVTRLPDLPLAMEYPTVGPQGNQSMDVNGLATSIEMFLGIDVLTVDGARIPVQWGGYVRSIGAYQGELLDKKLAQDRFRTKLEAAAQSPLAVTSQDWSALDLVLDHITTLVGQVGIAPR